MNAPLLTGIHYNLGPKPRPLVPVLTQQMQVGAIAREATKMIAYSTNKRALPRLARHTIRCARFFAQSAALSFLISAGVGAMAQTLPVIPILNPSSVRIPQLDSTCIARVVSLDDVPDCRLVLHQYKTQHDNKKQILDRHCWNLHILDLQTRAEHAFKGWPLGAQYDNWAAQVRDQKSFLCTSSSRTRQNHRNAIWDYISYSQRLSDKENALKYETHIDGIGSPVIQ